MAAGSGECRPPLPPSDARRLTPAPQAAAFTHAPPLLASPTLFSASRRALFDPSETPSRSEVWWLAEMLFDGDPGTCRTVGAESVQTFGAVPPFGAWLRTDLGPGLQHSVTAVDVALAVPAEGAAVRVRVGVSDAPALPGDVETLTPCDELLFEAGGEKPRRAACPPGTSGRYVLVWQPEPEQPLGPLCALEVLGSPGAPNADPGRQMAFEWPAAPAVPQGDEAFRGAGWRDPPPGLHRLYPSVAAGSGWNATDPGDESRAPYVLLEENAAPKDDGRKWIPRTSYSRAEVVLDFGFRAGLASLRLLNTHSALRMTGGVRRFTLEANDAGLTELVRLDLAAAAVTAVAINTSHLLEPALVAGPPAAAFDGDGETCVGLPRVDVAKTTHITVDLGEEVEVEQLRVSTGGRDLSQFRVYASTSLEDVQPRATHGGTYDSVGSWARAAHFQCGDWAGLKYSPPWYMDPSPVTETMYCGRRARYLTFQPRQWAQGTTHATLCELGVYVRRGAAWRPVLEGELPSSAAYADHGTNGAATGPWHTVELPAGTEARYLRLRALDSDRKKVGLTRLEAYSAAPAPLFQIKSMQDLDAEVEGLPAHGVRADFYKNVGEVFFTRTERLGLAREIMREKNPAAQFVLPALDFRRDYTDGRQEWRVNQSGTAQAPQSALVGTSAADTHVRVPFETPFPARPEVAVLPLHPRYVNSTIEAYARGFELGVLGEPELDGFRLAVRRRDGASWDLQRDFGSPLPFQVAWTATSPLPTQRNVDGLPVAGSYHDVFARFHGEIAAPRTSNYVLHLVVAPYAELWLDGELLVRCLAGEQNLNFNGPRECRSEPVAFAAGTPRRFEVIYVSGAYHITNRAGLSLRWSRPGWAPQVIVPTSALTPGHQQELCLAHMFHTERAVTAPCNPADPQQAWRRDGGFLRVAGDLRTGVNGSLSYCLTSGNFPFGAAAASPHTRWDLRSCAPGGMVAFAATQQPNGAVQCWDPLPRPAQLWAYDGASGQLQSRSTRPTTADTQTPCDFSR